MSPTILVTGVCMQPQLSAMPDLDTRLPSADCNAPLIHQLQPCRVNWRQVWNCIQRAQQGPWQLDVQALTPAAAPNGVLLTFELLLQQPAPYVDPGSSEQQAMGAKDSVTVISFVLDKKPVEIVVDASGR